MAKSAEEPYVCTATTNDDVSRTRSAGDLSKCGRRNERAHHEEVSAEGDGETLVILDLGKEGGGGLAEGTREA
jgi:hypothetical protein